MGDSEWRIATRRKGCAGWDIGLTRFTRAAAEAAARHFNRQYRGYEHRAVHHRRCK